MISLPHGCNCSELSVNPKNWKTCKASALSHNWYIQYYFYDTAIKQKKFVVIKGMNRFKTIDERREATKQLIENELYQLKEKCFNPITGKFLPVSNNSIEPTTIFIDALRKAFALMKLESTTKSDIKTLINFFEIAARKTGISKYGIQDIKRKHLMQMMEVLPTLKKSWSAYSYNNNRAYLMMLFKKLMLMEAVETNPVKEIPKQEIITRIKRVLTHQERMVVDSYLSQTDSVYHRFILIFFHSGCRRTELCRLKVSDVDLKNQVFKVLVKKGRKQRECLRPIKNIALQFWKDQMESAAVDDYVFSSTFNPGKFKLQPKKISNKWKAYVKDDLKIDVDFYALKHLNLDETSNQLNAESAAKMAGHTSSVITLKHYLVNEEQREMEKLKRVNNKFA
ncbi:MAG: site-specific integrase [Bacteroidota bacterium]|nr:site-specific integrase [Bacteroidota bacterium]